MVKLIKRDEIVKNFKDNEDKLLAVKVIDYIEQVQRNYEPRFTQFLDPAKIAKAKMVLEQFNDIKYVVKSAVPYCERNIIAIFPEYMEEEDVKLPLSILRIKGKSKFENIGHRDILGSIMSLGIKRDKIGDIIVDERQYFVVVYKDISQYITLNINKIKHTPVSVEYAQNSDIPAMEEKFKEIASTVASLRLDAVISAGFGQSRSSISKEITGGNVKVNWEEVEDMSFTVVEGDVISLKGKGRIILYKVGSATKKGRINIIIKKLI